MVLYFIFVNIFSYVSAYFLIEMFVFFLLTLDIKYMNK